MLYSSKEMNGNRELWPKASVTVTLPGKDCFPETKVGKGELSLVPWPQQTIPQVNLYETTY